MKRTAVLVVFVIGVVALPVQSSASSEPTEPASPPTAAHPAPDWYTPELHQRVLEAGSRGVEVALRPGDHDEGFDLNCLGYSPPGLNPQLAAVSAGGCMVHPHGCTMNFIFRDSSGANYIGTAGHCVDKGGDVVMQVATRVDPTNTIVTLARIGRVAKRADQGIGRDFGLVKIDPGWAIYPGVAGAAGPTGVLCLDPLGQPVVHYGHGYVFAVEQGVVKEGEVIPDLSTTFRGDWTNGYNWVGYGLPGDSGSPVMNAAGLAVGNLTHGLGIGGIPIPGLNFGTTVSGIFGIIGSGYSLVTVTGRSVSCTSGSVAV